MGNIILGSMPMEPKSDGAKRTAEGASVRAKLSEAKQLGLETRYVYRITQVANLGQGRQIVRVKNCSGPKPIQWVGAWNSGLNTNSIFFCFLFVKDHRFAWRANQ